MGMKITTSRQGVYDWSFGHCTRPNGQVPHAKPQ
jgi:hypothetical protein